MILTSKNKLSQTRHNSQSPNFLQNQTLTFFFFFLVKTQISKICENSKAIQRKWEWERMKDKNRIDHSHR